MIGGKRTACISDIGYGTDCPATVALSTPFRPMNDHVVVTGGRLYVTDGSQVRAYAPGPAAATVIQ